MIRVRLLVLVVLLLKGGTLHAQPYSMVIKGGHVIDPKNNIDAVMDIAVRDGKVAKVAKNIDAKTAIQVVNASGMYVTPGLIDIHGHVFAGTSPDNYLSNGSVALPPDGFTFRVGVTTIVDCGGAGWKSFPLFKKNIIDRSKTRVLSFLNIVGEGMRGGAWEQDDRDMDPRLSARVALSNREHVVGFKVAHYQGREWTPVDRAVEAGNLAGGLPVIVDFGGATPPLPLADLFLKHLRPGDIFTHTYTLLDGNVRETIVDEASGKVKPFAWEARKRGILFDVGYGGASFNYSQAIPAVKSGFYPHTISTDLHTGSMNSSMKDQLSIMSKFLAMGMGLRDVVAASTWAPAQAIRRPDLGNLSEGATADIAILKMRRGTFGFYDKTGYKMEGSQKFGCEMTIRNGSIVYDLNGIATPIVVPRTEIAAPVAARSASLLMQPDGDARIRNRRFEQVPAVGASAGGSELYVAWYSGGDAPGPGNYVTVSVSTDRGRTWMNDQLVVYPDHPGDRVFDPALWRDKSGTVHLFYGMSRDHKLFDGRAGVHTVPLSWDGSKVVAGAQQRLSDGILSNKPLYVQPADRVLFSVYIDRPEGPMADAPPNGAFIMVHEYRGSGAGFRPLVPYSSLDIPQDIRIHDEPQVVHVAREEFLCLIRTLKGIWYARSTDNGRSWSSVAPFTVAGPTTSSRFYIGKLKSGNLLLVYNSSNTRNNMTAALSADGGKTWPHRLMLDSRANVSYPDADQTDDGVIHVVFDRDRTGEKDILYCSFKEDDIRAGNAENVFRTRVNGAAGETGK